MDSLEKQLNQINNEIQKAADKAGGEVSLAELFDDKFMREYSKCNSFDEFCEKGGVPTDKEAFAEFPEEKMDDAVRELTRFDTWNDMQQQAATIYMKKQLIKQGFNVE